MNDVSGGEVDWNQVGRDFVTTGAGMAGGAFGMGLGRPIGASIVGSVAAAGAAWPDHLRILPKYLRVYRKHR